VISSPEPVCSDCTPAAAAAGAAGAAEKRAAAGAASNSLPYVDSLLGRNGDGGGIGGGTVTGRLLIPHHAVSRRRMQMERKLGARKLELYRAQAV